MPPGSFKFECLQTEMKFLDWIWFEKCEILSMSVAIGLEHVVVLQDTSKHIFQWLTLTKKPFTSNRLIVSLCSDGTIKYLETVPTVNGIPSPEFMTVLRYRQAMSVILNSYRVLGVSSLSRVRLGFLKL